MNDRARLWSRRIRGLGISEHAVCYRLADYHTKDRGCFPNHQTLCDELECSKRYLKDIIQRLERWHFLTRAYRFEREGNDRQTSNQYILKLDQFFPDPDPKNLIDDRDKLAWEGAVRGRMALKIARERFKDKTLASGILSSWIEIKKPRATRARPIKDTLWFAVESPSHENFLMDQLPLIGAEIREEFRSKELPDRVEIEILQAFLNKKTD